MFLQNSAYHVRKTEGVNLLVKQGRTTGQNARLLQREFWNEGSSYTGLF